MSVFHYKIEEAQKEMISILEVISYIKALKKSLEDDKEKFIPMRFRKIVKHVLAKELDEKWNNFYLKF